MGRLRQLALGYEITAKTMRRRLAGLLKEGIGWGSSVRTLAPASPS